MTFTNTFDQFTDELASKLRIASRVGIKQEEIISKAADIGDWLAREVSPRSPEQRLLKELWQVSDEREQQAIAGALVKMIQKKSATVH